MMADAQEWRERHRRYGLRVPVADVPQHLSAGYAILDDAEDIRDDCLMREPKRSEAA